MDNLYIDYKQGMILGTKIKNASEKLKDLLTKLNEIQEQLKNETSKQEDEDYLKALLTQTKIMYKLSEVVGETGNFLINVSKAYQKIDDIDEEVKD